MVHRIWREIYLSIAGDLKTDGSTTIWDSSNAQIPASIIEQGDGSQLDADTVDGSEPGEIGLQVYSDSFTVPAGQPYRENTGLTPSEWFL